MHHDLEAVDDAPINADLCTDFVRKVSTNVELPHHSVRSLGTPIDARPDQGKPAPEQAICALPAADQR